jgi:hypothetical protein
VEVGPLAWATDFTSGPSAVLAGPPALYANRGGPGTGLVVTPASGQSIIRMVTVMAPSSAPQPGDQALMTGPSHMSGGGDSDLPLGNTEKNTRPIFKPKFSSALCTESRYTY